MKVLDVMGLETSVDRTFNFLKSIQSQINNIQETVHRVISLDDALKGKGGDAIRSFYADIHIPFLTFMNHFLANYSETLTQLKQAVQSFEASSVGYINQTFLETELEQGLANLENVTKGLTNEVNNELSKIQDIIFIPNLDEIHVIQAVQSARNKKNDTIEQLQALDSTQTNALEIKQQKLIIMKNFITEIQSIFIQSSNRSVHNYDFNLIRKNDAYAKLIAINNPLQSSMLKIGNRISYISSFLVLFYPQVLFPISYRNHTISRIPPKFDKISETGNYKKLAKSNHLTDEETAAIIKHLQDIEANGPDPKYAPENYVYPTNNEITFWDRRKVLGNPNSTVTPDGLGHFSSATFNFFTEDVATVFSKDATIEERLWASAFIFGKPFKVVDKISDASNAVDKVNDVKKVDNNIDTPSELATKWQGTDAYPGIDKYRDIQLKEGKIIYRGEPNGSEYFTTKSAVDRSGNDAEKLFGGLQVSKHELYGYRKEVQGYMVKKDLDAAFGLTKANVQYGHGGLPQIFVPDVNELIEKGYLIPVETIDLKNFK